MPTVRDVSLDLLRQLGVTTIFGNPGSTELPMFREFPEDFRYVLGLQEGVVMAMADGFAQASRNAALVNLHSSAGTGHALGNLFTAWRNQAPVIVTAGQQARAILPYEPFLYAERPTEFPRPFVKWACEPARAQDVPLALLRAYRIAMTPPCGPVFVSIPVDDWDQPCEPLAPSLPDSRNPGDPAAVAQLAAALAGASRPALVLGAGAARDRAWEAAVALAERHAMPCFAAPFASRNVFPEDHPLFASFLPASREGIVSRLAEHDLVLAAGGPLNLYHTDGIGPHLPEGCTVWLVSDDPNLLSFAPYGRAILADSASLLGQLGALTGAAPDGGAYPRKPPAPPPAEGSVLDDRAAMAAIARHRPAGAVIAEEAPSSRAAMHDHLPMVAPDSFFTTAGGGLGYALPAAVGISLARPGQRVIAVLGDGSAMYCEQGLFSAAKLGVDVSFVILNNRAYEALRQFGRHFQLKQVVGSDLEGLDFCALARGHGLPARRAATLAELDEALAWSFGRAGASLVEVVLEGTDGPGLLADPPAG